MGIFHATTSMALSPLDEGIKMFPFVYLFSPLLEILADLRVGPPRSIEHEFCSPLMCRWRTLYWQTKWKKFVKRDIQIQVKHDCAQTVQILWRKVCVKGPLPGAVGHSWSWGWGIGSLGLWCTAQSSWWCFLLWFEAAVYRYFPYRFEEEDYPCYFRIWSGFCSLSPTFQ